MAVGTMMAMTMAAKCCPQLRGREERGPDSSFVLLEGEGGWLYH